MREKLGVLLVDDSRTVLAQLSGILDEIEDVAIVGMATNGAAAIRMATEARPDLILLDIVMPGLDGLSALRTIRSQRPEIDVVMVTSLARDRAKVEEALRIGASEVIAKPFDQDTIEALIEDIRDRRMGRVQEQAEG